MSGPSAEDPRLAVVRGLLPPHEGSGVFVTARDTVTGEERAEFEAIRAVVVAGHGVGKANAAWLISLVDRLRALVAASEADRADLLGSIGEMEAKHRAACASWERRLREQVAAAEERGAAAERERCADRLQQVIEERAWHTAAARDPLVVKTWYLDRLVVEWTGDSARVPTLAADYDTDAANSADAVARGQS